MTETKLKEAAQRTYDALLATADGRHTDAAPLTDQEREALIKVIVRIDGDDDIAKIRAKGDGWIAGVALGAWRREARKIEIDTALAKVGGLRADSRGSAPKRDPRSAEREAYRRQNRRTSDPVGAKRDEETDALADAIVRRTKGRA